MKRIGIGLGALLLGTMFLTACDPEPSDMGNEWTNIGGGTYITQTDVNGVDCIITWNNSSGATAMDCDW